VVHLIRRLCPTAKIYVARLNEEGRRPTVDSAIKVRRTSPSCLLCHHLMLSQAIRWAIDKKVDIISMSWTVVEIDHNKTDIENLKTAISDANEANILMFGAASDQGYNDTRQAYPAVHDKVICIGGARESGHPDEMGGRTVNFVFPGSSIISSASFRQGSAGGASTTVVTGSSFATALASGLAALVLYCVEICQDGERYRERLKQHDIMYQIYDALADWDLEDEKSKRDRPRPKFIAVKGSFKAEWEGRIWADWGDLFVDHIRAIIKYDDDFSKY
jgi:hypothetical protein